MAELVALTPPTLEEIQARLNASLVARIPDIDPLTYSRLVVLHSTIAGSLLSLYSFGLKIDDQLFPDTADFEHLLRAGQWRGYNLQPATYASGQAEIAAQTGSSAQIPRGTIVVAQGSGLEFEVIADATENTGKVAISIRAAATGRASNLKKSTPIQIKTPIPYSFGGNNYLLDKGVISEDLTGGADAETFEALRSRVLNRTATQIAYGKKGDFAAWARAADSSITGAWEFPNVDNIGTLQVSIGTGDEDKSSENFPPSGVVKKVFDAIANDSPIYLLPGQRPDGTTTPPGYKVVALAPRFFAIRIAIQPDTSFIRRSIASELNNLVNGAAPGETLTTIVIAQTINNIPGLTATKDLKYLYPVNAVDNLSSLAAHAPADVVIANTTALRFKGIDFKKY